MTIAEGEQMMMMTNCKPSLRKPIAIWINPEKKAKNNTSSTLLTVVPDLVPGIVPTLEATMRETMAVGPTLTSLEVPNMAYIKRHMKLEYSPYCKARFHCHEQQIADCQAIITWAGTMAMLDAYARHCGTSMRPTVMPERRGVRSRLLLRFARNC